MSSSSDPPTTTTTILSQHVIVMRHGHRLDNFDATWTAVAARPWDPPLYADGFAKASDVGDRIRRLNLPIHRVFVSPFLRCVQTAARVVEALCGRDGDGEGLDPSKVKVAIEYGLCEMLNNDAIRSNVAPKDGRFDFNIPELEAMLPAGTVDRSVTRVYKELPRWGESDARSRYKSIIRALADKYPSENLLLVTHGEGVGTFSSWLKGERVYDVQYCGYVHAKRQIYQGDNSSYASGIFELLNIGPDENSISFETSPMSDGV
ncbi:hypothetical protein Droror1_Dr00005059 [Drosera rotundifolia]